MSRIDELIGTLPAAMQDPIREEFEKGVDQSFEAMERIIEGMLKSEPLRDLSALPTEDLVKMAGQVNALLAANKQLRDQDRQLFCNAIHDAVKLGLAAGKMAVKSL